MLARFRPVVAVRTARTKIEQTMRESTQFDGTHARPVAPYIGGKRNLARRLADRIEAIPHDLYAEPFIGMGGVFLARRRAAPIEVINDISADVATLFRILQRHYQAFLDMLRWQLTSREIFERLKAANPDSLTDLERAARFLYLQRTTWGGKVASRSFGVSHSSPARFNFLKLEPMLAALHERLSGVIIERLPYADLLERYDRPGALFYLDPPYWGSESYYGPVWSREEFGCLADMLRRLQGHWLLSINDVPEVRSIFAWADMEAVNTTWTTGGNRRGMAGELIISRSQV